jgi:hypothetical protein
MDNREICRNGREEIMGGEEHRRGVHDRDVMRGVHEGSVREGSARGKASAWGRGFEWEDEHLRLACK